MLRFFNSLWSTVPTVFIDTETTGVKAGIDKAVSVALVRFEDQKVVRSIEGFVNPGRLIPAEATAIHGVTDEQVRDAPTIEEFFRRPDVQEIICDAQPGGYNCLFDRQFVPPEHFAYDWPWLDTLTFIRKFDRYIKGKKRHTLSITCERRGIKLVNAHTAAADAEAAGLLFYNLGATILPQPGDKKFPKGYTMGQTLAWQKRIESTEWERFFQWKANQAYVNDLSKT